MTTLSPINPSRNSQRQRGAAILIMTLILMLGLITLFTFRMDRKAPELEADRKTALALAQAKEALLGYAVKDANRPGSLPCPDANDDGMSNPVDDYTGTTCVSPVGRLPWRTLGLSDLRDGYGERFWYAVSPVFSANNSATLNSSNLGQITTRDANGAIIHNATTTTGAVATIIAPGAVLVRQGAINAQNRTCVVGTTCNTQLVCNSPFISVPKCNPINYLDLTGSEDNQNFVAGAANGFIAGIVKDASGNAIVNDRMASITTSELFSIVTLRMARELANYWNTPPGNYFPPPSPSIIAITSVPVPTIWSDNNWNTSVAVTVTGSTSTAFTLSFASCSVGYTVTIDNLYRVTRIGHC